MSGISCLVNFKENLSKNIPYYDLLLRRISGADMSASSDSPWVGESAGLSCNSYGNIVTRICEGYQFTIVFSGDISAKEQLKKELKSFGYHILSDSDAEITLLCYIHFGEDCVHKLSGNFSFIIYDAMRRVVFAVTDSEGSAPLFYSKTGDNYVISSSVNNIFAHPETQKKLSRDAVLQLLTCQNCISSNIFDDVYMLTPHSYLKISKNKLEVKEYRPQENTFHCYDDFKNIAVILSGSAADTLVLENLPKKHTITVYGEKFPYNLTDTSAKHQHLLIDDGTVFAALENTVSACGFPFLSSFDFLLPIALRRINSDHDAVIFSAPDRFYPEKNYTKTLIKNGAFYYPLEQLLKDYSPASDIFPAYSKLIANSFDVAITLPQPDSSHPFFSMPTLYESPRIKTALRHILLDIISKEHAPILAFFKRTRLLRLCEGGFLFGAGESESELMAYLIKLNMWFETNRPRIV